MPFSLNASTEVLRWTFAESVPMNDHVLKMPTLADMTEAARLARTGRLDEATTLIQRGFSEVAPTVTDHVRPSGAIETVTTSKPTLEFDQFGVAEPDHHASLVPERLRDALGQILRGLRGGAPSIKGLTGLGLQGLRPQDPEPHDERFVERRFMSSAGARDYKLFMPTGRSGARPLVVMLHGCSQSPEDFAAGTRMNELAERDGIYVAYPRQTRAANAQKCWNWFETRDQGREQGEAGIIAGLTRAIIAEHDIDSARVYIAGLSAGGAAAANIASAYPDLYAGVGIHSGLAAGCARDMSSALMAMRNGAPGSSWSATDTMRVPTIVFHGTSDETVNPRNGEEILAQARIADLFPTRETGTKPDGRHYTRTRYADSNGRIQVEAWRINGAGHAWSGGSKTGSYTDPRGPDASRAMLDFFAEHELGGNGRI